MRTGSEAAKQPGRRPYSVHGFRLIGMILLGGGLLVFGILTLVLIPQKGSPFNDLEESSPRPGVPAQVDDPAPQLALTDLSGKPASLKDYQGSVVLVNNWATWCPPCKAEMPVLNSYFRSHRQENFTIIAIDAGETAEQVRPFVHEYGLDFPVWLDEEMRSVQGFRNNGLPSSYLIDRRGTVRLAWTGETTLETLEKYVTPLLQK